MLPAMQEFVARMREVCEVLDGEARWNRCRELLGELLKDEALRRHAENWPVGGFDGKKVDNLLFYEDRDHKFVINGLIKNPGGRAMIHDHGETWTVYGLLRGSERIVRYREVEEGGRLGYEESYAAHCGPGDVDVVRPWEIHSEYAGDEKTVAVIVRSRKSGTFEQFRYEGGKHRFPGPNQVPYDLTAIAAGPQIAADSRPS